MQAVISIAALQFYIVAIFGMLAHSAVKWAKGEVEGNMFDWYLINPRMSVLALLSVLGGTAALLLNGTVSDITLGAHILAVFGVGYGFDSGVNKQ